MNDRLTTDGLVGILAAAKARQWAFALAAMLVGCTFLFPFTQVPAGSRGVMTTFGKPSDETYAEGIHFRIPFVQEMHLMDVVAY